MSDDGEYLQYDDELIMDEPSVLVRVGSKFVPFVLAAVDILAQESLWNPDDDVALALRQVEELKVRLMMTDFAGDEMKTQLPLKLTATELDWNPAAGFYPYTASSAWLTLEGGYTNGTNSNIDAAQVYTNLEAGLYCFGMWYKTGTNMGKFVISSPLIGTICSLTDAYAASPNEFVFKWAIFEVITGGNHSFIIERHLKNPASSACVLQIHKVYLRKVREW